MTIHSVTEEFLRSVLSAGLRRIKGTQVSVLRVSSKVSNWKKDYFRFTLTIVAIIVTVVSTTALLFTSSPSKALTNILTDTPTECGGGSNRVDFSTFPKHVCDSIHACYDRSTSFCFLKKDRYKNICFTEPGSPCAHDRPGCKDCLKQWSHLLSAADSVDHLSCPDEALYNCGYPGISEAECNARACCFYRTGQCGFPLDHHAVRKAHRVLVSVVIACHKQERFVRQAMDSVFTQIYSNWELIIVDDGTPGKKCSLVASFFVQERSLMYRVDLKSRVKIVYRENYGLAASRNFGVSMASGKYICALDADDLLTPSYLENAMRLADAHWFPSILYSDQIFFGQPSSIFIWILPAVQSLSFASIKGPLPVMSLFRRDLFHAVGGYKEEMMFGNEDYEFWLRCFRSIGDRLSSQVVHVSGPGSWYRLREGSMMRSKDYEKFSLLLLQLHHPSLYAPKKFCEALNLMACAEPHDALDVMQKLERVLLYRRNSCLVWVLLGVLKIRYGCAKEGRALLLNALHHCSSSGSTGFQDKTLHPFLKQFFVSLENEQWKPQWANFSVAVSCSASFDLTCTSSWAKIQEPLSKKKANLAEISGVPIDYWPYASFLYDRLLSNDDFRSSIERLVRDAAPARVNEKIPNIIHFVYAFKEAPVSLYFYQYVAVMSAIRLNKPEQVYFHYKYEPSGLWWDRLKNNLTLVRWSEEMLNVSRCFFTYAHESDVVRLRALQRWGGIYIDMDMISLRPLYRSFKAEFAIGRQESRTENTARQGFSYYGLGNAAMLSIPNATFVDIWLHSYSHFRACGHDPNWDEHSVRLPADIIDEFPILEETGRVWTLPAGKYYSVLWGDVGKYLEIHPGCDSACFFKMWPDTELFHLWTSGVANADFAKYLEELHPSHPSLNGTILGHIVKETLQ